MKLKRGSTSVRRLIFIADSSSTTGAGLANLVYNSSGLVAYYFAGDLNNEVQITLATATLGTFASGGFIAVDNTNMPGWYEIGIPDAALDAGNEVAIQLRGATNMVPVNIYIELDAVDYQTDAFGALKPTVAGRTLDVSTTGEAGIDLANVGSPTTSLNLTNTTISTSQTITSVSGAVGSISGVTFPANFSSLAITGGGAVTAGTVSDKTGYSISGTTTTLDALQTALNSAHGSGSWATATGFSTHSASDVWAVGTRTITGGTISTVSDKTGYSLATAPPTAAAIADAVWDETRTGHTTSGTFGFYLDAAVSSVSSSGGLTTGQETTLNNIYAFTSQIAGSRIASVGPVKPGGDIELIIGKDYLTAADSALSIPVADTGGALYDDFTSATLAASKAFGAARENGDAVIAGTIASVSYAANVTTFVVEIPASQLPDTLDIADDWKYQIHRVTNAGKKVVGVQGRLETTIRTV